MRSFFLTLMLLISPISLAQAVNASKLDPDLIDAEMVRVMYRVSPTDLKTNAYENGLPSAFRLKLCTACQIKVYSLKQNAEILLDEQPLALQDLAINLIKKKYDVIQLGIDRSDKTITYLYLGGISELSAEELAQEQSDEN